jgi:hypothetical protein
LVQERRRKPQGVVAESKGEARDEHEATVYIYILLD